MFVADHPGAVGVEVELGAGGEDHARVGLSPFVLDAQVGEHAGLRVEGAGVPAVDEWFVEEGAFVFIVEFVEQHAQAVVACVDIAHGAAGAGDAALVGDDDERVAGVLEGDEGLAAAGDEERELGLEQVAPLDALPRGVGEVGVAVDGVVAIEEDGGAGGVAVGGHVTSICRFM